MTKAKVIITDYVHDDLVPEREVLADVADVVALNAPDEAALQGKLADADALMVYHVVKLSRKTLAELKRCKVISRVGVGFDNVDGPAARELGIPMANIPDYGTEEVADSAMGLTLALTRGIARYNTLCKSVAVSWSYLPAAPLHRLRGRVFGIVGLGRIGTAVASRAKAFGLDVLFYDPYRADGYDKSLGIRRARTFDELLQQAHIVSFHCPLTDETRGMFNQQSLAQMAPGGFVINTARGPIVDTSILPEAIATGQLAGAGLDVIEKEPPPESDPLLVAWRDPQHPAHDRVIINPHAAFYCEEGLYEMRIKAAKVCLAGLTNVPLRNLVN